MNLPGVLSLLRLTEAESTQTLARSLAEQGAEDRTLVWAERQTRGRGRMSRKWDSRPGGLYVSLILRPGFPPSRLGGLGLLAAQAAARSLSSQTGIRTGVKPPNDVLAFEGEKPRKICGILAEASGDCRRLHWVVLGVGINVNNAPSAQGATSLKALTGRSWDMAEVLRGFLKEFNSSYAEFGEACPS